MRSLVAVALGALLVGAVSARTFFAFYIQPVDGGVRCRITQRGELLLAGHRGKHAVVCRQASGEVFGTMLSNRGVPSCPITGQCPDVEFCGHRISQACDLLFEGE